MNKQEIAQKIKETEEQLASLRAELEKEDYPTLQASKPGDKLANGCIVVHKFEDVRMALIAAPKSTDDYYPWSKEFDGYFKGLQRSKYNISPWFIPNIEQLELAYKNCRKHFSAEGYWSSCEVFSTESSRSLSLNFCDGYRGSLNKPFPLLVRAFSLVSYE